MATGIAVTTTDDDATPTLSINDVSVTEGNIGSIIATFTISLSSASGVPVSVTVDTADVTATAGADYTALTSVTVTIPAGQTSATVNVPVLADLFDEPTETYNVNLSDPVGATISDGTGVGTILDNDPTPTLSINDVTTTEGNIGSIIATFTISLSAASGNTVTVTVNTADVTATAGADYTAVTLATVTMPAGQTFSHCQRPGAQ